jgi:16S rRNA (cytosine1402-N4)-methyltransferase
MHEPVLLKEVVELLAVKPGGVYVDCTLGGGGHARAILDASAPDGVVHGFDRDGDALDRAARSLAGYGPRCRLRRGRFATLLADPAVELPPADGILMDLGISSNQLDDPERGLSFLRDGPLDMRMDRSSGPAAADLVRDADAAALAGILFRYGEEPDARRIAAAIVRARAEAPIDTTLRLADVVARAKGRRGGRLHPATRTFMALRIAVNGELDDLEAGIGAALRRARVGGRVAAISFHSLEDRIVKRAFARHVGRTESLQQGGVRRVRGEPPARWVARGPVLAGPAEVARNPRARSAKLRVVERIGDDGTQA